MVSPSALAVLRLISSSNLGGCSTGRSAGLEPYTFAGDDWIHSANEAAAIVPTITDELHAMLVKRADDLDGCSAGSDEERELTAIERAIGAYEAVRWPTGKVAGS